MNTFIFSTAHSSPRRTLHRLVVAALALLIFSSMKAPAQNAAEKVSPDAPVVTARGAHHRVWQRERLVTLPDGRTVNRPTGFTELATGLHYLENGAWQESRAEFAVTSTGAAATRGQHQVFLAGNINSPDAIEIRTADQRVLKFRPVCLASGGPPKTRGGKCPRA
jgi:hypothetical protein